MTDAILHRGVAADAIVTNLRNVGARARLGHDGTTGGWIVLSPVEPLIAEIVADESPIPVAFVPADPSPAAVRAAEIRKARADHARG